MKPQEKKDQFVIMRAQGRSYDEICKELSISKATCTSWNSKLSEDITAAQERGRDETYETYKAARQKVLDNLSETLSKIDMAIGQKDFEEMPLDKLLKYKLEYMDRMNALTAQNTPADTFTFIEELSNEEMEQALLLLYNRVQGGEMTAQQGKALIEILGKAKQLQREISNDKWTISI